MAISGTTQYLGTKLYGMRTFDQLFTNRQLIALTLFSDLVQEARSLVCQDAESTDSRSYQDSANAISTYLAFAVDKGANYWSSICTWHQTRHGIVSTFGRQAIPMVWDFAEANPFSDSSGNVMLGVDQAANLVGLLGTRRSGLASQEDAASNRTSVSKVVSTDPPYYDNVPYADLSDFFYVWLRKSLQDTHPSLFSTLTSPKVDELVAFAHLHGGKTEAEVFFLEGMTQAMGRLAEQKHSSFPVTIYYAFRQQEQSSYGDTTSTGWEIFLDAVIRAGLTVVGTWPIRTEYTSHLKRKRSALASSIVLVCHTRPEDAPLATRRQFVDTLKSELPNALAHLQSANIAPVDLAQATIGPGMAVYTRYAKVVDATGNAVTVREALALINETLDEVLSAQEGDFDADTRWALAWFEQHGFEDGEYGVAETLSKAKNTTVRSLETIGVLQSRGGKVRLSIPLYLRSDWDPRTAGRVSAWLTLHHLIRVHDAGGEQAAAALVRKLGSVAETARELAYRLYAVAERTKRSREALWYNALVQSWPEIARLARKKNPNSWPWCSRGLLWSLCAAATVGN